MSIRYFLSNHLIIFVLCESVSVLHKFQPFFCKFLLICIKKYDIIEIRKGNPHTEDCLAQPYNSFEILVVFRMNALQINILCRAQVLIHSIVSALLGFVNPLPCTAGLN